MTKGHYTKFGRISRAEALRRMEAIQAELANPPVLSEEAERLIDNYTSPTLPAVHTQAVKEFMRTVIAASSLTGTESIRKYLTHIKEIALHAIDMGLPLTIESVITTTVIDDCIRNSNAGQHLLAERGRRLMWLAAQVNPGPTTPSKLSPIGHRAIKPPYLPHEMTVIRRVALEQPTETKRRNLCKVVGLGGGCGADSADLRYLRNEHLAETDEGILVAFQKPRPRQVVCRAAYEPLLRQVMGGRPGELLYGVKEDRRNLGARAIEAASLHGCPRLEMSRLRATWLADVMTDPIPVAVILKAAGLRTGRTLAELLPHLDPWIEAKGLNVGGLRGDGQ